MSDLKKRESFSSKIGFIAAAAGSAVGLGNIYRFPVVAGDNGGGAFLFVFIVIVLLLGLTLVITEFLLGRRAKSNVVGTFRILTKNKKTPWQLIGFSSILTAFIIIAFYSDISGWTLDYISNACFDNFADKTNDDLNNSFKELMNSPWRPYLCQFIFIGITMSIIIGGVQKGIERASKILMPLLVIFLIILAIKSLTLEGAKEGLKFFLMPDFSKITWDVVIDALGQVFFSLSIGMGTMITFSSYTSKDENLCSSALLICTCDTIVSFLAGLIIFPAAMAFGIAPESGPMLIFNTFPLIFNRMTGGFYFCIIFFILIAIAALTSLISLLEIITIYLVEEFKISRTKATIICGLSSFCVGIFATLSLRDNSILTIGGMTLFDFFDFFSSTFLLPLGGLFIVIFLGWKMKKSDVLNELSNRGTLKSAYHKFFYFMMKYIAPIAILVIFINFIQLL